VRPDADLVALRPLLRHGAPLIAHRSPHPASAKGPVADAPPVITSPQRCDGSYGAAEDHKRFRERELQYLQKKAAKRGDKLSLAD
jgi:hypothetical protein